MLVSPISPSQIFQSRVGTFCRGRFRHESPDTPEVRREVHPHSCAPFRWLLVIVAFALSALTGAHAQSVRWETADSGDPSDLQLIFEDCSPDGDPQLPRIEGTTLTLAGTTSQTTMNNFSFSRSTILTYRVRSQRSGPIQIPAFSVQTNKGSLPVPTFTGGATRSAAEVNIVSRLEPGSNSVWAGEVFPLTYVLDVPRRSFNQFGTGIEWNPAPLIVEEWSTFQPSESTVKGESRLYLSSETRGYAKSPGPLVLNAANQLVNIQSGSIGFGLFQTPRVEQLSVTSNRPSVLVRPLPAPTISGFSGAVGQFKLTSKIVPTNASVGEPVTWTLELSGTGNWPDIAGLPSRDVSRDFDIVQPQAKRTPSEGKLFDAVLSEDVVLVPTRAGDYTLGPIEFVYFDPASGSYKTASTPRTTVTISPLPVTSTASPIARDSSAAAPGETPPPSPRVSKTEIKPPVTPKGIPLDPLPGSSRARVPLPVERLTALALLPFAALPILWAWFALRRAQQTDPLRPRRDAHVRLAGYLAHLRAETNSPLSSQSSQLLLKWQHDTAVLWEIPLAAPAPVAIPDAAWTALWSEADHALYSTTRALPADWTKRAETALAAKRVKSFSPLRLFLPQNLLPFVASIALVFVVAPLAFAEQPSSTATTSSAENAYRSGDFAAAEKAWAAVLANNPTNPIARYNLSLALAQQDRWPESVAQATASFVQAPSDSPARWQLILAGEKAGFLPGPISKFFPAGPRQSLANLLSPGMWQVALMVASSMVAVALATLLYGVYHRPSAIRRWSGLSLLVVGMFAGGLAVMGLQAYGIGAHPEAVVAWRAGILRSIPTEADTTQQTTSLAAGSMAVQDNTFLGWVRLTFDNGQTGWVRQEDVIPLWR